MTTLRRVLATAIVNVALIGSTSAFAATGSNADYQAAKERISADYDADKKV